MERRERWLTPLDRALLSTLERAGTLTSASQRLGISRDRAVYRLRRLSRGLGRAVVVSRRGGVTPGATRLTPWGVALLRRPESSLEGGIRRRSPLAGSTFLSGRYRATPFPHIASQGIQWHVAFPAREGEWVRFAVDPEAAIVSLHRFSSSARNRLRGVVQSIVRSSSGVVALRVLVGEAVLHVTVTAEAARDLRLRAGLAVYLYIKATALHRVGGAV